mmetsp:Transcript_69505/g.137473  ORF Transcript_69505/g.137473 Transcript_69505/m.137473 type:complete len:613 (+) Transcript_69505:92-1930(+)
MSGNTEELRLARLALQRILTNLHVLDALPERSKLLAVDAELPVHTVLNAVLGEQHLGPQRQPPRTTAEGGTAQLRREGSGASTELPPPPCRGSVLPSLPSDVLAEVCEFEPAASSSSTATAPPPEDAADERAPSVRRWTSLDDGWGLGDPMQDLEKMPMGMPVTVGELADFLVHACEDGSGAEPTPKDGTTAAPALWAQQAGAGTGVGAEQRDGLRTEAVGGTDVLEWSLACWRAQRLRLLGHGEVELPLRGRIDVQDRPDVSGQVWVHLVPGAPPRPILCTDDPEASLMKAVELLLAYPELDALPIVSPVRGTVVAHLTLSYCLAYMLSRLCGSELLPLVNLSVCGVQEGADEDGMPVHRVFSSASVPPSARVKGWAERPLSSPSRQPAWVLQHSQPVRDLLLFFARTYHSGIPVVEDGGGGGGVLGLLSRRDLLHFLDLGLQFARSSDEGNDSSGPPSLDATVRFDANAPVKLMLDALQRFRPRPAEEGAGAGSAAASAAVPPQAAPTSTTGEATLGAPAGTPGIIGATLIYEQRLPLKALLLQLLAAENRKLVFVKDVGNGCPPKLLRVISASDVWRLLVGGEREDQSRSGAPKGSVPSVGEPLQVSDM